MAYPPIVPQNPTTGELSIASRRYLRAAISPNTERAYRAQLRLWETWCADRGIDPYPAPLPDVVNWLAARADAGQAAATLRTAVAALKFGHDFKGHVFDPNARGITKVLRGIQREAARLPRQAPPLRPVDLMTEIAVGRDASCAVLRDAALVAVGYLFALRRSELVGLDFGRHGDGGGVLLITARALEVTLVRSKTSGDQTSTIAIPRAGNELAVDLLTRWIAAAGIRQGDALFRRIHKGGSRIGARLTPQSVGLIVKRRTGAAYSGHSLRVGFAVAAAEAGADLRSIATVTRHRSMEMPRRYAERADQLRTSPYNLEGVTLARAAVSALEASSPRR